MNSSSSRSCRRACRSQDLWVLHSSPQRPLKTACRMIQLRVKLTTKRWHAVLNHLLPHRTPHLLTVLMHMLRPVLSPVLSLVLSPVLSLRLIKLALHQRRIRLLRQEGLLVGGKHLDGSPPPLLWLVEGRGQQAGRVQAGVGAEVRPLLLEQLSSHLGGQPLEALLANGVDRRLDCLVGVSVSRPWQKETNLLFVAVELDSGVRLSLLFLGCLSLTSAVH